MLIDHIKQSGGLHLFHLEKPLTYKSVELGATFANKRRVQNKVNDYKLKPFLYEDIQRSLLTRLPALLLSKLKRIQVQRP